VYSSAAVIFYNYNDKVEEVRLRKEERKNITPFNKFLCEGLHLKRVKIKGLNFVLVKLTITLFIHIMARKEHNTETLCDTGSPSGNTCVDR
jgi:hypothetical protein